MYTLDGTFAEVIAFLEGYYNGLAKAYPKVAPVLEWFIFQEWLSEKTNTSTTKVFSVLRDNARSSEAALEGTLAWLLQFRRENEKKEIQP